MSNECLPKVENISSFDSNANRERNHYLICPERDS